MTRTIAILVGLAACTPSSSPAPSPTPSPTPAPAPSSGDACTTDADCTITTYPGCCECKCAAISARSTAELTAEQQRCALMKCGACVDAPCEAPEPVDRFTAVCRNKVCVAVRK